jgi:hypothetical protein
MADLLMIGFLSLAGAARLGSEAGNDKKIPHASVISVKRFIGRLTTSF